jgi:dsRNA-specific ribonuclease
VPHILGLTASPVMRSDPLSLTKIEETLDAITKTPTKHRAELRLQVKLPLLMKVFYRGFAPESSSGGYSRMIESLGQAFTGLKFSEDPYVLGLIEENTEKSLRKLENVRMSCKTWCQDQMKSFHATSLKICRELGSLSADFYISEVITKYTTMVKDNENALGIWDVPSAEKQYLNQAFKQVEITHTSSAAPDGIPFVSDKVRKLIECLLQEPSMFSGIVFVQERAMVSVLAHLLSVHPDTRARFRIGTMVGTSAPSYRARNVGELIDLGSQRHTLSLFKAGIINLVIATSVLEEGIDVPACNVVFCFQKPANLKSFVQRRGRARHRDSKLILLLDPEIDKVSEWQQLEMDMKKIYEDEMRLLQEALILEDTEEADGRRQFRTSSSEALLDLDNAVHHLYNFCAQLPAKEYVDLRPEFICSDTGTGETRARVILPLSVNERVRTSESQRMWRSQKNAIKDAAFEAYVALYKAGLVNDNLLPLPRHDDVIDELTLTAIEKRASIMVVTEQLNPWVDIAKAWSVPYSAHKVIRQYIAVGDLEVEMYSPVEMPRVPAFRTYWDSNTELIITPGRVSNTGDANRALRALNETWSLLHAAFGHQFPIKQTQIAVLFSPNSEKPLQDLMARRPFSLDCSIEGLIRDKLDSHVAYVYNGWLSGKPSIEDVQHPYRDYGETLRNAPHLSLIRLPRRMDFLHHISSSGGPTSMKSFSFVLPTSRCTVDDLPFKYVQLALLIPSIMHRFEIYLIAKKLSTTILKDVGIADLSLIVTAISASSANEDRNYQRLEFLGDSILKLCTSVQLMAEYPLWHEGYLSSKKDRLVANSRLARSAVECGLDSYIITKPFTGHKWRPVYVSDLLNMSTETKRNLSSKVLADVVESLIGAAVVDGGMPKALACLRVFLPEISWQPLDARRAFLYQRVPDVDLPINLQVLERLIGYQFNKKALLIEALTHASCNTGSASLERLEFLGDCVLDNIVVTAIYAYEKELSHVQMHLLRTALVNADFLAFICMEWAIEQERAEIVEVKKADGSEGSGNYIEIPSMVSLPLWRFMKHMSPKLGTAQIATSKSHSELRDKINEEIRSGSNYPWALLAGLQARKFYSDLIESILGAVWIDSGSFETCKGLVERMGILPYLRRMLRDEVHILHPKEEIGMLADTETVKYVIAVRKNLSLETEGREYLCKVYVGDLGVVEVNGGVSREEVKTRAAEVAVRILKTRKENGDCNKNTVYIDGMGEGEEQDTVIDTVIDM